jgi:hypothetical protein
MERAGSSQRLKPCRLLCRPCRRIVAPEFVFVLKKTPDSIDHARCIGFGKRAGKPHSIFSLKDEPENR